MAAGETSYYKKELDPQLLDAYRKLLKHAKAMLVARLADQTEATRQLLEKFDAHYQRLKLARRALRFDDVTRSWPARPSPARSNSCRIVSTRG